MGWNPPWPQLDWFSIKLVEPVGLANLTAPYFLQGYSLQTLLPHILTFIVQINACMIYILMSIADFTLVVLPLRKPFNICV